MQKTLTFVALRYLSLDALDTIDALVPPDSFLCGSAPHLQHLSLRIPFPFPVLRKLLLSVSNLVVLSLHNIPHSGSFYPRQ
jgi:hypothetical protein